MPARAREISLGVDGCAGKGNLLRVRDWPQRFENNRTRELSGDSGEAERVFRREAERHSEMIPNTIGA